MEILSHVVVKQEVEALHRSYLKHHFIPAYVFSIMFFLISVIETGDNCTLLGSCDDPHAECDDSTGTCECIDGFFLVTNGTCLACLYTLFISHILFDIVKEKFYFRFALTPCSSVF